ncbi:MAG: hypothetical protein HYY25_01350 [Candidatus Wallbacteria bacterium]|nr:hypothetical protein [Candidatus Wallbacteria bacterium]
MSLPRPGGRAAFAIALVIGVFLVACVVGLGLLQFSRENRFAIRRFYLTVQADVLLDGAMAEAAAWLQSGFAGPGAIPELAQFLDDPAADASRLSALSLTPPLPVSTALAEELELTLEASVDFEKVQPFHVPDAGGLDWATQARVVPDPKECQGWAVFRIRVRHESFSRESSVKQAFKLVHPLPDAVTKFTLFVRDQDPAAAGKGSPRHLNNLYLDATSYLCRGLVAESAPARPLTLIHTGADLDTDGAPVGAGGELPAGGARQFDASDVRAGFLDKGWVFLGTPAPEGTVLNLTSGQIYDYLGGKVNLSLYPPELARRYAGERFHTADVAELMATTFTGASPLMKSATFDNSGPQFPAAIPASPMPGIASLRFKLQFFNFCSVSRDMEHGLPGLEDLRHTFSNYYRAAAADVGYSTSDYRTHHPALLHLFGSEQLDAGRYRDSRSPTMVLGPVRRKSLAIGSVHQESDYERGTATGAPEPFTHPPQAARQKTTYLPWFDIDAGGQNRSTTPEFTAVWNQVDEADPSAGVPPALPGLFTRRSWYLAEAFLPAGPHQIYYKNFAMSRFFEEPYLYSADTILANNVTQPPRSSLYSKRVFADAAARAALVTLGRAGAAAEPDEAFFYDTNGPVYTGGSLELRGARLTDAADPDSAWRADAPRALFRGNLRALSLFSSGFQLGSQAGSPTGFDLRRKATHLFATIADFERTMLDESDPAVVRLRLDGELVYVAEAAPAVLGATGRPLVVDGPGTVVFQGPVTLESDVRMAAEPPAVPRGRVTVPPFAVVSVTGAIVVKGAEIHASLVALDPQAGTIRRGPGGGRLRIVGSVAVDHLELGDGLLRESTPPGNRFGTNTFEVSPENLFARGDGDWEPLELVYNDSLEPTLWERYRKHYRFKLGRSVAFK